MTGPPLRLDGVTAAPPSRDAAGAGAAQDGGRPWLSAWTGAFLESSLEAEFRDALWPEWARRIRTVAIISAVFILALGYADYVTLGPGWPLAVCLTVRVLVFLGALGIWQMARAAPAPARLDRATLLHVLGFCTALFIVFATVQREMMLESTGAILLTLGIYVFLPLPMGYLVAAALYASAGFLVTAWLFLEHTVIGFALVASQLALCNVLGGYTALRSHGIRRREWFSLRELRARELFDQLVARLSSRFISLPASQVDAAIDLALSEIAEHCNGDRAYVFEFGSGRRAMSNTYEWCRPGIAAHRHELQNMPVDSMPWLMAQLSRGDAVAISRVADLPAAASAEKVEFGRQGIRSLVLVPMILDGNPFGFVGFDAVRSERRWDGDDLALLRLGGELIVSVLARKRYDEALQRQAEQLKASNRSLLSSNISQKGFTRAISHELQEPLRNITSFSGMLARRYRGRLDADADEFIGYLASAATRMRKLIEDMAAYATLDSPVQRPARCDTGDLVRRVLAGLKEELDAAGGEVRCGQLPAVFGDEHQLELLFEHLLHNAVKFRDPLRRPEIVIGAERAGSLWRFSVSDNGIGVPAEHAEKIFEPFHRLHQWHHLPGSGLGLAACRHIVERHGGHIRAEPNEPFGTTVEFSLPALM